MNDTARLNRATEQIHIAAQYLAMIGKSYVPSKSDDSHTNLGWDSDTQQFFSRTFMDQSLMLFLRPHDLRLGFGTEPQQLSNQRGLHGLTQAQGANWVREQLSHLGMESESYKIAPHYELPKYADFRERIFEVIDKESFLRFSFLRSWAKDLIVNSKMQFDTAEDDRTWPHHFDHGCYVPLRKDDLGNVTHSISFGLAIHDNIQNSHYLYVTHWSSEPLVESRLTALTTGRWEIPNMNGALLPITLQSSDPSSLTEEAKLFMEEAIRASLEFLKIKN